VSVKSLLNNWRFFGIGKEECNKCLKKTFPDNLLSLYKANIVAAILALVYTLFRFFIDSKDYLTIGLNLGTGLVAIGLALFVRFKIKQFNKTNHVSNRLIYALIIIFYLNVIIFGIYLGVWSNPGKIAGAFLGILICALFLFDIPAIFNACLTLTAALVFSVICVIVKTPDNWIIDLSNSVFAGILGLYVSWHIIKSRITKSLLSDEADAANKAKSLFLANMSHEIRTPMNSIIGFSELAMYDNISPKTKDYLTKIHKNSEWLLQLINDILDISKIESGRMELENIPFDLHEIFVACRTMIMPKAIEKSLVMHFYAEPSVGKKLYGDPIKLHQVLVNLLSNAVKFTNTGTVKMLGMVKKITADSVTMYFEIKDSGIGITPEQKKKIFTPFTQAEAGTTRKFGGSGLGLVITKNLIEIMGGTLYVESIPGVGSKFNFELTFNAEDITEENKQKDHILLDKTLEKPIFEGEILVCEDNVMNQQVICEHLSQIGIKTEVAYNGQQGVAMVQKRAQSGKKQFDLIFMDIHMPVMDGIEATVKIFEIDPNIPIIAMTANVMLEDRDIYISVGMKDCVSKPFTSQVLWRCLTKFLTPVKWDKEDLKKREQANSDLRQELINIFVKNNNGKFEEIKNALNSGDIKQAHRLAHTLKGNAGQLNRTPLMKAAWAVETGLKNGINIVTPEQMETLKTELTKTLAEFEPQVLKKEVIETNDSLNSEEIQILFEKLEILLKNGNPECLIHIKELRGIEGSEKIIQQMEDFKFDPAMESLAELKKKLLI